MEYQNWLFSNEDIRTISPKCKWVTQRKMFSLVSTIFDPLGILSPLTIRIKMLLQQVWKLGKKWDEPLPAELHSNLQKVLDSYFAMPMILKSPDGWTPQRIRKIIISSMSLLTPQPLRCQQLLTFAPKNRTKSFKHLFCLENAKLHQ